MIIYAKENLSQIFQLALNNIPAERIIRVYSVIITIFP